MISPSTPFRALACSALFILVFFQSALAFSSASSSASTRTPATDMLPVIIRVLLQNENVQTPPPPPPEVPPVDPSKGHDSITQWIGADTCLQCHMKEAEEMFSSVHYQWLGDTPYMTNGPETQGKMNVALNNYCINITGNWEGCGSCHAGLGEKPQTTKSLSQLKNIDCLVCHQEEYKRKKVDGRFIPDVENMSMSIVEAAKTVHLPNRKVCLSCHAKGGGGDNYKRGDLALAHGNTSDRSFDVHMATTGGNLDCQSCHITEKHRIAGKGSDLRPTDLQVKMNCTDCHTGKDGRNGHANRTIGNHVARIACQTCHIGRYARDASDTQATEETETHRNWLDPHQKESGVIHPTSTLAGNLLPKYKWWDGSSRNYNLFDDAVRDENTGNIATSTPHGSVTNSLARLYPFKYKTALQPLATQENTLIALDSSVYFTSGDAVASTVAGLVNMGLAPTSQFEWVTTETYQLITHEVMDSSKALSCLDCHDSTSRMDLQGELGYALKGPESTVCTQCHGMEDVENPGYYWIHNEHVTKRRYTCSKCHEFSRPERTELY